MRTSRYISCEISYHFFHPTYIFYTSYLAVISTFTNLASLSQFYLPPSLPLTLPSYPPTLPPLYCDRQGQHGWGVGDLLAVWEESIRTTSDITQRYQPSPKVRHRTLTHTHTHTQTHVYTYTRLCICTCMWCDFMYTRTSTHTCMYTKEHGHNLHTYAFIDTHIRWQTMSQS